MRTYIPQQQTIKECKGPSGELENITITASVGRLRGVEIYVQIDCNNRRRQGEQFICYGDPNKSKCKYDISCRKLIEELFPKVNLSGEKVWDEQR